MSLVPKIGCARGQCTASAGRAIMPASETQSIVLSKKCALKELPFSVRAQ
jgi:hypothetical protein